MKQLVLTLCVIWSGLCACAQVDYHVPDNYALDSLYDYHRYEADALKCLRAYLDAGFIEIETEEHSQARAFGLLWIAGHPDMHLDLSSEAMPFIKEEGELLYLFMFGSALAYKSADGELDQVALHKGGIMAVLGAAEENKELKKIKSIRGLRKLSRKGKLEAWIKTQLHKTK